MSEATVCCRDRVKGENKSEMILLAGMVWGLYRAPGLILEAARLVDARRPFFVMADRISKFFSGLLAQLRPDH